MWVAEDLRTRAALSPSYDAADRREYRFPNGPHQYTRTSGQPLPSPLNIAALVVVVVVVVLPLVLFII